MSKKKVVFFGTKKIGLECLKILFENQSRLNYEITGVLNNDKSVEVKEYSENNKLNLHNTHDCYLR